jgi:hypothetical protein
MEDYIIEENKIFNEPKKNKIIELKPEELEKPEDLQKPIKLSKSKSKVSKLPKLSNLQNDNIIILNVNDL